MVRKISAGRVKSLYALALLFGPAFLLVFIGTIGCDHKFKTLDDFGKVADYSIIDSRGKKFTSKDFEGDIVLVTTLQEGCPNDCAILFWNLNQAIYQHIKNNKKKKMKQVKIISFATDGKGNPIKDLTVIRQLLEDKVEGYDPDLWIVASGDVKKIYDFERNNESLLKEGDEFYGGQAFQELFLLIDKKNHLRMVLSGTSEGMVRRMKEHMALLQKEYDKANAKKLK